MEEILSALRKVKKSGSGWTARCPAHEDQHNSLSISIQDDKILLKCHAGCATKDILEELGLEWKHLFSDNGKRQYFTNQTQKITVTDLAADKQLPEKFLRDIGLEQRNGHVRITYYIENGSLASRQRKRFALSAKKGSVWEKGDGKPVPYGLWKLREARQRGYLIIVEGESDTWTLWFYGFPCLGLPGADMSGKLLLSHLDGIRKIYIIKEPDKGGETFVNGLRSVFKNINYNGVVFVIEMNGHKDPNDLHKSNPDHFTASFSAMLQNARPMSLEDCEVTVDYGSLIKPLPEPEDTAVIDLMAKIVENRKHAGLFAAQGSGKSYSASFFAVKRLLDGESTIISAHTHLLLNQFGKTIKNMLVEKGLSEGHLFHLKGASQRESGSYIPSEIPSTRPMILLMPHVYLSFKGKTPYHYPVVDMIMDGEFGRRPLLFIDEFVSFLESCFVSKKLGFREGLKQVFGKLLYIVNQTCPLNGGWDNCTGCKRNDTLAPRRDRNGMIDFHPVLQRHEDDRIYVERSDLEKHLEKDMYFDDKTMRIYALKKDPLAWEQRLWSAGGKNDPKFDISLATWSDDFIARSIEPHVVYYYPYDVESGESIGRPLTVDELEERKSGKRKISAPHQVCDIPVLQGWDVGVLRRLQEKTQVVFMAPSGSSATRYVVGRTLSEVDYYVASVPYVKFDNVLIISIERELYSDDEEVCLFMNQLTGMTKVLSFYPTYRDARQAEEHLADEIRTCYYDGKQHVRNGDIVGTSIEFDLCLSCIHGRLGEGLDLSQFKLSMANTGCERPKALFAAHPSLKTNREYVLDDVADNVRQALTRILRLAENEQANAVRVFVVYGRNAWDIAHRVQNELGQAGHGVKAVNAGGCIKFAELFIGAWLNGEDTSVLEEMGFDGYEREEILEKAKAEILEYLKSKPGAGWREILQQIRMVKDLSKTYKKQIARWFNDYVERNQAVARLEKLMAKIEFYCRRNANLTWKDVYDKFHLARKTEEERELVKNMLTSNHLIMIK